LPRDLLQTSSKFRPLLKVLQSDMPFLTFDFQLSGRVEAMNFKWLESDFKKKVQDYIPNFIERHIEKKVEEAINSITQE
jgi:hypothetical protein